MKIRLELGPVARNRSIALRMPVATAGGCAMLAEPRHGLRDLFGGASGNPFSHTVKSVYLRAERDIGIFLEHEDNIGAAKLEIGDLFALRQGIAGFTFEHH